MDELKEKMTNFKEQVRQAADLLTIVSETVSLKRRGTQYWGCCPFHGEKTPSFKVDPARGLFHCFGCGAGGDVFSYVMKRDNLTFPEALKQLAEKYGIPVPERAKSAREIAREYGAAVADTYADWQAMERSGVDTTALLANHINHPARDMHALFVHRILEQLL